MTEPRQGPTVAERLVDLAHQHYTLGISTTGDPFAWPTGGGTVARPLRGGPWSFRAELARLYTRDQGRPAGAGAIADALLALEGECQTAEPTELALRVAATPTRVLVDLGDTDETWVEITPDGWTTHTTPTSRPTFRRTRLTAPLPQPDPTATLAPGVYVHVTGWRGTYRVHSVATNGDITLYGPYRLDPRGDTPQQTARYRACTPDRIKER